MPAALDSTEARLYSSTNLARREGTEALRWRRDGVIQTREQPSPRRQVAAREHQDGRASAHRQRQPRRRGRPRVGVEVLPSSSPVKFLRAAEARSPCEVGKAFLTASTGSVPAFSANAHLILASNMSTWRRSGGRICTSCKIRFGTLFAFDFCTLTRAWFSGDDSQCAIIGSVWF